jgi:hypothetical protein
VKARAEFTLQFIVSRKSRAKFVAAAVAARNNSWSSNGSLADIDDGIIL